MRIMSTTIGHTLYIARWCPDLYQDVIQELKSGSQSLVATGGPTEILQTHRTAAVAGDH